VKALRGYATLGVGAIGTVLAIVTLLVALLNWAHFREMDWPPATMFILAALSGMIQWIAFHRRQFRTAMILFFTTLTTWSAGACWYANEIRSEMGCTDHPCAIVFTRSSWP
jgi:predicted membrane channel-forming protein YqfA (hemolysin III family)